MKEFIRTLEINQFMTDYVITPPEFEPLSEFILNERPLERPEGKYGTFVAFYTNKLPIQVTSSVSKTDPVAGFAQNQSFRKEESL